MYSYADGFISDYEWFERWRDDSLDGGFLTIFMQRNVHGMYDPPSGIGRPFMRKNIHNEELVILLNKYSDKINIEQSGGFHSGTDFIGIGINLSTDDRTCIMAIETVLSVFFNNNHMELTKEYGIFNRIRTDFFYTTEDGKNERYCSLYFKYSDFDEQWVQDHS